MKKNRSASAIPKKPDNDNNNQSSRGLSGKKGILSINIVKVIRTNVTKLL